MRFNSTIEELDVIRSILNDVPEQRTADDLNTIVKYTRRGRFMASLMPEKRLEIARIMGYFACCDGDVLVEQGAIGTTFFIVLTGKVRIIQKERF